MATLRFEGWDSVCAALKKRASDDSASPYLSEGQRDALHAIASRVAFHGVLVADEVGMGKTRLAVEVAKAVIQCSGRVACVIPPGLGYQWKDELSHRGIDAGEIVRGLHSYLQAWGEKPAKPWHDQPIVLVSHNFANWRFGDSSHSWRWALLPETVALFRKFHFDRLPRGYNLRDRSLDKRIEAATSSVVSYATRNTKDPCYARTLDLAETKWNLGRLFSGAAYAKDGEYRKPLGRVMGLGLGTFDLVIIDEAHKSRSSDSGLSSLLEDILVKSRIPRRVALTATPIEIDPEQWLGTLGRVGISEDELASIKGKVEQYEDSLESLRYAWRNSTHSHQQYLSAAREFEEVLTPYVVRRDKRQDESVAAFVGATRLSHDKYRSEHAVDIDIAGEAVSQGWRKAVLAAESLSFCSESAAGTRSKHLRLTVGNGHGIASLIDESLKDTSQDSEQAAADADRQEEMPATRQPSPGKEQERVNWWTNVIRSAFTERENILFDHPAIRAAVDTIEAVTRQNEKVLVFGRFTKPLRALTLLLNARELLRRVVVGNYWPQAKVHAVPGDGGLDEPSALRAARRQLELGTGIEDLDTVLSENYAKHESRRRRFRENLLKELEKGLTEVELPTSTIALFHALAAKQRKATTLLPEITLVSRAILEASDSGLDIELSPAQVAQAFHDLLNSAGDSDDFSDNSDPGWAASMWFMLHDRLREEYTRPEGGYARLMNGSVELPTRRLLQMAFNRPGT